MAGLSTRFGGPKNKQLCLLNNKPIFSYSIDTFAAYKSVNQLLVVVNKDNKNEIENYISKNHLNVTLVLGGITRQKSVENALKILTLNDNDIVMIHDGARPLIDNNIIEDVKSAAEMFGASTSYLEATDTIAIKDEDDLISSFQNRSKVALVQTPQAFKYGLLKEAHKVENKNATDDCTLVFNLGGKIKLVKGDKKFHKITTIEDVKYLEGLLK